MRLYFEGRTFKEIAEAYHLGISTVRDRVYNAQERTGANTKVPNEKRRRAQALAWKTAAILLDAVNLTTESRKEEMMELAQEQLRKARIIDEQIGQP